MTAHNERRLITARRLAIGIGSLSMLSVGAGFLFATEDWGPFALALFAVWIAVATAVGGLVASRRPENAVGWLLLATAACIGVGLFTTVYAAWAFESHAGTPPLGAVAAWLQTWLFAPTGALLLYLVLLFPTGRLPSPRWRWVGRIGAAATAAAVVAFAFMPGPLDAIKSVDNPLGIPGARPIFERIQLVALITLAAAVLLGLLSIVLRLRRARGDERQQVKWFTYNVVALVVLLVASTFLSRPTGIGIWLGFLPWYLGFLALPISIGIAILRYRLYDIDRIVSRTLSYAIVTALLGGIFALVIVVPALIVGSGRKTPDYQIAIATLVAAALFRPVLRRVQSVVDRRFNRRRYDAEKTVGAFTARLREQIDIDALGAELTGVVRSTMQPTRAFLWLKQVRT
jgi:MFS family permease